jgi:hypothetical protein
MRAEGARPVLRVAQSEANPNEGARRRVVDVLPVSQRGFTVTPRGGYVRADMPAINVKGTT